MPRKLILLACLFLLATAPNKFAQSLQPPGFRPAEHRVHALKNATIVTAPGKKITAGTIVLRDGVIESVGKNIRVPADARIWDLKGNTIYAGFIESYWTVGSDKPPVDSNGFIPIRAGSGVNFYGAENHSSTRRPVGPGYEIHGMRPEHRLIRDFSLSNSKAESMRKQGFTTANVTPTKGILRGVSSLINLGDGRANEIVLRPNVFQHAAFETMKDVYPASLMGVIAALRQTFYDAKHYKLDWAHYEKNAASRPRPELNLGLNALQSLWAEQRLVIEPGSALMVEQAANLAKQFELQLAIVSCGEEWRRPELAKAANAPFIVPVNFPSLPKMPTDDDWLDISLDRLRRWDWASENPVQLRKLGIDVAFTTHGIGELKDFRKKIQLAIERGLTETDALAALTTVPAKLCGMANRLGTIEKGKIANLTIVEGGSYFNPTNTLREVWVDGQRFELQTPGEKKKAPTAVKPEILKTRSQRIARGPRADRGALRAPKAILVENANIWTCSADGILKDSAMLIIGNKIRSFGAEAINDAKEFGKALHRIDAKGGHLTPGLIDCHSHTAILGGVNEGTLPSTAMVGIADVIHADKENLYEQLAGGLTIANLLHGSANPIDGRNAVIKLKYGEPPSGLLFKQAPKGIKFALGENVKQSNWGDDKTTRFPQSRMGVPTFHANRFTAAKHYLAKWKHYREHGGRPPRKNIELDVIGEIIEAKRWIHCHSYRQDEMIAFLRTMEKFDVQVGTLQHVLEGYKIADEIAAHGAGGSSFSDWWGYKFEVYDAIPYSGAIMWERGVNVSFNSDSSELARRMNLEAAKAVKYGGVPETEALKFVTLNPARQLKIDRWVGSLEPGKHADFVLWSGHPLAASSLCSETWIEGKQYFDITKSAGRAKARQQERTDLIAKAKKLTAPPGKDESPPDDDKSGFFRRIWETMNHMGIEHCQDCELKGGAQ